MNRRDFLQLVSTGLVTAAAGGPASLFAQQPPPRPKIMLFGLTAVTQNGQGIRTVLPAVSNHGAFICGPAALVRQLANGKTPTSGPNSGIDQGHPHIGGPGTELVCLEDHAVIAGSGRAQFEPGLAGHLPNVPQLAGQMQPGPAYAFAYPTGSIDMSLNGGMLRMPQVKSNNVGTHNVDWRFEHNSKPVGNSYGLTDLLVFDSATPTLDIAIGPARATMQSTDVLWFVNIPTFAMPDTTVTRIEHAHDWFTFLNSPVNGKIEAVTTTTFKRPAGGTKIEHPCLGTKPRLTNKGTRLSAKYFPPDTDPCFIAMA
jgi:hypothetical protein